MAKSFDKKLLLLKIEGTEGTDSAPAAATDALQTLNYRPTFMDADSKSIAYDKPFFGADPVLLTSIKRGAAFDMLMTGAGATASTIPPWMLVNRLCGFDAGVVTGGNSVVQTPSSVIPSATQYTYLDNLLIPMIGARGSMSFRIEDDDFPRFSYTLLGRAPLILATEAAPLAATFVGYGQPTIASTENTTFSFDGYAVPMRSLEMNANVDLQYRSLIGPTDRVIARGRSWSGTLVVELPDLATKNLFQNIRSGTTVPSGFTHGTVTGNIVQGNMPRAQITGNVELSEEQGIIMATLPITALPTIGNDEITFTSK